MRTVDWCNDHLLIVDQTRLPDELVLVELRTVDDVLDAIGRLAVRGAPALGVVGALGVALASLSGPDDATVRSEAARIRAARPTAVNLAWGVDRALAAVEAGSLGSGSGAVIRVAVALLDADAATNRALGERGADLLESLIPGGIAIQTHCNAGALACVEWGTALGIVRSLHARGHVREVFVGETRPLLQGARLTAWELDRMGVPFRVVVDGAGPSVIARGLVDAVVVGADRIAANGDVANKVGTYPLALAAARAGVPFIVAAPESTLDAGTPTGADIAVEERPASEVVERWDAFNPAFDITPHDLVTAVVTEDRVIR